MKKHFLRLGLLLALLLAARLTPAQTPSSGGPSPQTTTADPVPLDGGASVLLASGVAYGLRRLQARRKAVAR